jgi:hypothetical protein
MDTHLRCTGGVKRERIARIYTIPAAVSTCLDYRSLKRQGVANTEADGADLSRSDMDRRPGRFCGEGTTSFSSMLTLGSALQLWRSVVFSRGGNARCIGEAGKDMYGVPEYLILHWYYVVHGL